MNVCLNNMMQLQGHQLHKSSYGPVSIIGTVISSNSN